MDIETGTDYGGYRINKVSRAQGTKNVQAYCKVIKDAGYKAYYYGNPDDLGKMCDVAQLGAYGCWLANYVTSTSYSGSYDFWQYSSKGKVKGISGNVDCNFWYQGESTNMPTQVTGLKVTETKETTLCLKWNAVTGATRYDIYVYSGGKYTRIKSGTDTWVENKKLTTGTKVTMQIRAVRVLANGTETYSAVTYTATAK
jgi:hypothetical protein